MRRHGRRLRRASAGGGGASWGHHASVGRAAEALRHPRRPVHRALREGGPYGLHAIDRRPLCAECSSRRPDLSELSTARARSVRTDVLGLGNWIVRTQRALRWIGIGLLPAYICVWRSRGVAARLGLTLVLAFIVWWNFLVGHILNNLRGLT